MTTKTYTLAEKAVSDALIRTWRDADDREDWEVGELVKAALDALNLPWVAIQEGWVDRG